MSLFGSCCFCFYKLCRLQDFRPRKYMQCFLPAALKNYCCRKYKIECEGSVRICICIILVYIDYCFKLFYDFTFNMTYCLTTVVIFVMNGLMNACSVIYLRRIPCFAFYKISLVATQISYKV